MQGLVESGRDRAHCRCSARFRGRGRCRDRCCLHLYRCQTGALQTKEQEKGTKDGRVRRRRWEEPEGREPPGERGEGGRGEGKRWRGTVGVCGRVVDGRPTMSFWEGSRPWAEAAGRWLHLSRNACAAADRRASLGNGRAGPRCQETASAARRRGHCRLRLCCHAPPPRTQALRRQRTDPSPSKPCLVLSVLSVLSRGRQPAVRTAPRPTSSGPSPCPGQIESSARLQRLHVPTVHT